MLVYYYAGLRSADTPEPDSLDARALLVPPVWTNGLAWRHGFYEMIENRPLAPGDRLDRHVFQTMRGPNWDELWYIDECRTRVEPPSDGQASLWGLASYRDIDDEISDALGVPRAPLDDQDRAELAKRGRSARP
jgi:hypothetical protein